MRAYTCKRAARMRWIDNRPMPSPAAIKLLGRVDYAATAAAMRTYTEARGADTRDEIWLCEHAPVYTQGIAGKREHVHDAGDIAVVHSNRGGQVTYHGPGQVVAYPLVDLRRLGIYVKEYVFRLEAAVLAVLDGYGVTGHRVAGAPGVYVRLDDPFGHAVLKPAAHDPFRGLGKIAALGIKVTRHCAYHGIALNVAMDLEPFDRIDPCGHAGLKTIDLARLGVLTDWNEASTRLGASLAARLAPR
jgi:lipoyl(octanoyl) transferase